MDNSKENELFHITPREFAQERARRTYEALMEAAHRVFTESGFDATQTPDIAAEAGVSVGTFYRYFTDKRDVFLEVLRHDLAWSYKNVMGELSPEKLAGPDRRKTLERTLGILVDNVRRAPNMNRVFLEMSLRDDKVAALRDAFDSEARRAVADIIAAICPRDQVADPEATAYIIHTAVVACAQGIAGDQGEPPVSPERGLNALTELVYRALFGIDE
jgi:AcrR family transcriptional regulator